ncbi:AraC family transcriptional regulator [Yersinia pestis]|uniref:AraC-type regulatory protein n=29 Tax=Yersinia pseudotuberculosis complex TaxID=1649845 RepID=A0AAX2I440_YERPE|nr:MULTISPECIES: AraC family transcriptional regulator [Yersinia pseudotuberculosis complex]EDR34167.1 transcriptional regulator, AraC family [Yersinia pestis biovar Orientalis str. IP275]EFA47298.1 transcriptional regulator, AraC family [Yersinia pestis KIM D27]ERP78621.1 AraC family transcriptional regulator [Yersinia pestis 24H]ERP78727.1 AraC family transcriptional regulator [Yersinia pestis S3]AAM87326.1 putative AraC-type regulatory protein [Yersinia pestis KIM10+]
MTIKLISQLTALVSEPNSIHHVYFAKSLRAAPLLAQQVNFPRMELIIEGSQAMIWDRLYDDFHHKDEYIMHRGDILFIPSGGWNIPQWEQPVITLSILFGKQSLGFSLLSWDGESVVHKEMESVLRRGPRVGAYILQALNEMSLMQREQTTVQLIVRSLISHCIDLLRNQVKTPSRSQTLFESIREYIERNYSEPLTRESVAHVFHISPNYLSHLFRNAGNIGFNESVNSARLENAKILLKFYEMKIKEVANVCGFIDSNYFCRLFRKETELTPSEYRQQYRSNMMERDVI